MAKDFLFVNSLLHRLQRPAGVRQGRCSAGIGRGIIIVGAQRECKFAEFQSAASRILKLHVPQQGTVVREAVAQTKDVTLDATFALRAPSILDREHLAIEPNVADIR